MFGFYVIAESGGAEIVAYPLAATVIAIILLVVGYRSFYKKRLIENVPTSKCQGVTIGLNELKGTAVTHFPLTSYLAEKQCVYYSYKIEEQYKETTRDKDGKKRTRKGWKTISSETHYKPFELHDDTGSIRIQPKGAEFHGDTVISKTCRRTDPMYYGKGPRRRIRNSTGRRRFSESIIPVNEDTYVMGTARIREDIVEPEIADDEFGELFLISSKSEEQLVSKFTWAARGSYTGAIISAALAPTLFTMEAQEIGFGEALGASVIPMVLVAMVVAFFIFALYLKTVFNGLVDVRNRVDRAWSMLEVEYKRRHDLIPNLVEMVKGFADHEKETLEAVTEARGAAQVGSNHNAGQASAGLNQQSSALGTIFAVVEDYPDIKADESFRKLMEELTRTEDKISLARTFYNDSVERANNRIQTFPDMLLAPLAGAKEEQSLMIEEFEKKPIKVDLTPDESADEEVVVEDEQVSEDEMEPDDEAEAEPVG